MQPSISIARLAKRARTALSLALALTAALSWLFATAPLELANGEATSPQVEHADGWAGARVRHTVDHHGRVDVFEEELKREKEERRDDEHRHWIHRHLPYDSNRPTAILAEAHSRCSSNRTAIQLVPQAMACGEITSRGPPAA